MASFADNDTIKSNLNTISKSNTRSIDNVSFIFDCCGHKKKDISQQAVSLLVGSNKLNIPIDTDDMIDVIISKMSSENKPVVIVTVCKFLSNIINYKDDSCVSRWYYKLIPSIVGLTLDVKLSVRESSRELMEVICNSVTNKDIVLLKSDLIKAMVEPENTVEVIDKLASTTFVSEVKSDLIAIICPLIVRGYNIRSDSVSRLCSKIMVNMLKLVEDYNEVSNFLPILIPVVSMTCDIVSDPEARGVCEQSLQILNNFKNLNEDLTGVNVVCDDSRDLLCDCNFTLAYGSNVLLKNVNLRLHKGYRYGLISKAGGGKSTLLKSIAEGKVEGFPDPEDVNVAFVQSDIIGEKSHLNCVEYIKSDNKFESIPDEDIINKLSCFGFATDRSKQAAASVSDCVSTLSGGWRMKLALSKAMMLNPDILLLESPTDHLDVVNIKWVEDYLNSLQDVSCIFTSHDKNTLNNCCTHIIELKDYRIRIHKGNLDCLIDKDPVVKDYFNLHNSNTFVFRFPEPGYIEGIKSKSKALLKMEGCSFTYPGNSKPTIEDISIQVSLSSRIAIVGPNGAGKSTQIKLLIGENIPQTGTVYKHPNVRISYVSQHSFNHIDNHLNKTPSEYIRWRYEIPGEDREAIKKKTLMFDSNDEQDIKLQYSFTLKNDEDKPYTIKCVVDSLTGLRRKSKSGEYEYQVKFSGKSDDCNLFIPLIQLEKTGAKCFLKMVKAVDEKIAALQGLYIKPLTRENVETHMIGIGLEKEFTTHTKLHQLSDGQKVKVVLGAALWHSPHIILLDEPTNYLDHESLVGLIGAIKDYEGGVVVISHNQSFTDEVANETWLMQKNEDTGIATLSVTGGESMVELIKNKDTPSETVDAFGNKINIIQKKKPTKSDLKKLKKRITQLRASGADVWTDEELEKAGFTI